MNRLIGHWLFAVFAAILVTLAGSRAAIAGRHVALIVGNAKYEHADTLANTINDADAVAAMFTKVGFDVVDERRNVGVVEFKRALRDFARAASDADIVVVYYSGHGLEFGGVNYLVPVDAKLASDIDVEDETLSLDRVIQVTEGAKKLSLIILDACRDNPFLRSEPRVGANRSTVERSVANRLVGIAPTSANTLIAYAAKAGSVSYDGTGANSPFTTALVKYLAQPGLDIRIALGKVRDDVLRNTGNRQEPFVYGSLGGDDISLAPGEAAKIAEPSAPPAAGPSVSTDYEMAERVGSAEGWEAFLATHASGYYATLARAQLAKLMAVANGSSNTARGPKEHAPVGAGASPPPGGGGAMRPDGKKDQTAALQEPGQIPKTGLAVSPSADQPCAAQAAKLAQLRQSPAEEEVKKFSKELTCEDLRPQVDRFMESLGIETIDEKTIPAQATPPAADSNQAEQNCKRDAAELVRIRANPDRAAALRFARELKCEDLRSQASRLLESMTE